LDGGEFMLCVEKEFLMPEMGVSKEAIMILVDRLIKFSTCLFEALSILVVFC
jgi:hypothetical protein